MELRPAVNVERASKHTRLPGPALCPGDPPIPAEVRSPMGAG